MRSFIAGGFLLNAPDAVRSRIFSRFLDGAPAELELHCLGVGAQVPGVYLAELTLEGTPIASETLIIGFASSMQSLPFPRVRAAGLLELWVTQTSGGATTVSGHTQGVYVDV